MPETYEELRLTVTLIDNASAGLVTLRQNLRALGGSEQQENLVKMQREVSSLHGKMGKMREEMGMVEKTAERLGNTIGGTIRTLATAFVGEFAISSLKNFANEMDRLSGMAGAIGVSGGQIKSIVDQLKLMGVDSGAATSLIRNFTAALADLQKMGSGTRQELMQRARSNPEAMANFIQNLIGFAKKEDLVGAINEMVGAADSVFENYKKEGASESRAASERNRFLALLGLDSNTMAMVRTRLKTVTAAEEEEFKRRAEVSREFNRELAKTDLIYEEFVRGLQSVVLPIIREVNAALGEMGEGWGKAFGAEVVGDIKLIYDAVKPVYDILKWVKDNSVPKPATLPHPDDTAGLKGLHPTLQRTFGITPSKENIENWQAKREQGDTSGEFWDWFSQDLFKQQQLPGQLGKEPRSLPPLPGQGQGQGQGQQQGSWWENFKSEIFSKEPSNAVRGSMLSNWFHGNSGVPDFGGAAKGMGIPDWMSSVAGGAFKAVRVPGDAMQGKYTRKPEKEGQWSEDDEYWQQELNKQKIHDAFGMSAYGAQASGSLAKNLMAESLPGALKRNADRAAGEPAEPLPTVQDINRRRAMRGGGFQRMSFGGGGDDAFSRSSDSSMSAFTRAIRTGVFEGMVDFKDYLAGAKSGGGGGGGFQNASLTTGGAGGAGDNTPIGAAFRNASLGGTGGGGAGTAGGFQMPGGASVPSNIRIPGESGGVGGGRLGSGSNAPHGSDVGPGTGPGAGDTPPGGSGNVSPGANSTGTGTDTLTAGKGGKVDPGQLNARLRTMIEGSKLSGMMPPDAAKYGMKTGSAQEWANLMTGMAGKESSFDPKTAGDVGKFGGAGSHGLFQLSPQDAVTYGIQKTPFTKAQLQDPDFNAQMAVKIAEKRAQKGGIAGPGGMADYWAGHNKPGSYLAQGKVSAASSQSTAPTGAARATGDDSGLPPRVQAVGEKDPEAFITHHTSGRGTVAGVQDTLRQRGLGVQYVMDREGNIVQTGGAGSSHMRTGWGAGAGLSNKNTVGMEIIAKNDKDVTPQQAQAYARFMAERYPNTPIYGHGEVNPGHKEADEGLTAKRAALAERQRRAAAGPGGTPNAANMRPTAGVPYSDLSEGRRNMDRDMGNEIQARVHGTGKLSVDVKAPAGTKVDASGQGLFSKVEMDRQTQMAPAQSGPPVRTPREPEQLSI